MVQNGYEEEIDLMLLCRSVFKKWKIILVAAVVGAVLAVVYQFVAAPKSAPADTEADVANSAAMTEYEQNVAEIDAEIESYKADIASYQDEKEQITEEIESLDERQEEIMKKAEALDEYKKDSVILNLDPYNVVTKTRTYYISNDYQIMPGMDYQNVNPKADILSLYMAAATSANADINEVLHTAAGTNYDRTVALCNVTQGSLYGFGAASNGNSSCITITTIGEDEATADKYMNKAIRAMEGSRDEIVENVAEHELMLMDQSTKMGLNSDLKDAQEAFDAGIDKELNDIVSQRNSLNNRITTINNSMHTATNGIQTQEKNKAALEKPSSEIVTSGGISKKVLLKWILIGTVAGAGLACLLFAFLYIISGTVKSEDEIEGRYGIQCIGSAKDEVSVSVAAASVNALMKSDKDILLISSLGYDACTGLYEEIKNRYPDINAITAGDIGKDVAGVDALSSVGKAVLLEKTEVSKIAEVGREISIIKGMGIDIIGCVM